MRLESGRLVKMKNPSGIALVLAMSAGLFAAGVWVGGASAQGYPTRPVTMIVPYAPGGTGEVLGRALAQEMSGTLGRNVIVELRPGAGGNIGAEHVARVTRADGYTFLLAASSLATSVSLMKLNFDPRTDLAPVAGIAAIPNLMVISAESPLKSVGEVIKAAKARPNELTFGSSGLGTGSHLAGELFKDMAGIQLTHVPYKGSGAVYPDLVSQRVTLLFDVMGSAVGQVQGGRVRALATTSRNRSQALPDVPTIAEQGFPDYEFVTWFGFFARAGTPPEALARLEQATAAALQSAAVRERLSQIGSEAVPVPAVEFRKYFNDDVARWARLVKEGKVAPLQ
ncbi:MAG: tripartite tricarboxylate transporter substrate binding protein [Burkholderiales bacterium]